ncbi:hypothetical protein JM946_23715 [Steroidobacter sp. S1-65]|uniref:Uncharacterized protein n=1 Tax=Steroidobacter gossypii TaxID=2805490 RepID=A0ABS1X3F4_9GAMM|nr:hypothetical protein [Steroidobacter gossypii]
MLMLSCASGFALGRDVGYEELPHSSVTSLETCGQWQIDGQSGRFRILQAYLYGGTMLFVDMVRPNARGTWLEVARGFTFAELNNDHLELELFDVRCSPNGTNSIVVTGRAELFESSSYSFTIEIDGAAGTYQMKTTAQ